MNCLECKFYEVEDIYYSGMCDKNHTIETEEGLPLETFTCEDFEQEESWLKQNNMPKQFHKQCRVEKIRKLRKG